MTQPRKTNGQVAAKFGISARTVSRMRGRSRSAYIEECRALREKAAALRDQGMTWKQIGEALGLVSENAARAMTKRARGEWGPATPETTDERQQDLPL